MIRRAVTVHTLAQAVAALEAARDVAAPVRVIGSATLAAALGPLVFREMERLARARVPGADALFALDCAERSGLALRALRLGVKAVLLAAPDPARRRVAEIAGRSGAALLDAPELALDLDGADNPAAACRRWLAPRAARRYSRTANRIARKHSMAEHRCRLYAVTPPRLDPAAFAVPFAAALDAGDVAVAQLRLKEVDDDAIRRAADVLRPIAQARGVAFLMNDRPDLAVATGCDGVHVGQEDASYAQARRLVGDEAIVGVTCHDSRHLAMEAGEAGADYVAFGAFFPTATKDPKAKAEPEILEWWSDITTVPCVAIGGITVENCPPLVEAGADFLAVVGGIWNHPDGPAAAVRAFNRVFDERT